MSCDADSAAWCLQTPISSTRYRRSQATADAGMGTREEEASRYRWSSAEASDSIGLCSSATKCLINVWRKNAATQYCREMSEKLPGGLRIPLLLPEDSCAREHLTTMVVCGTMMFQVDWPCSGRLDPGWETFGGKFGGRFSKAFIGETRN